MNSCTTNEEPSTISKVERYRWIAGGTSQGEFVVGGGTGAITKITSKPSGACSAITCRASSSQPRRGCATSRPLESLRTATSYRPMRSGRAHSSACTDLPAPWRRRHGVHPGSKLAKHGQIGLLAPSQRIADSFLQRIPTEGQSHHLSKRKTSKLSCSAPFPVIGVNVVRGSLLVRLRLERPASWLMSFASIAGSSCSLMWVWLVPNVFPPGSDPQRLAAGLEVLRRRFLRFAANHQLFQAQN